MVEDLKSVEGDKWRANAMFKDYCVSLDALNNEDKEIQNKKQTHFFRYVSESLHNHFKQWTNDLLFLSLFLHKLQIPLLLMRFLAKLLTRYNLLLFNS